MSSQVSNTIQKLMQNVPVSVSLSDNNALIVTSGSEVLRSGLVDGRVQPAFRELCLSTFVGNVVDAQVTDSCVYVLNSEGTVFSMPNNGSCQGGMMEVYIPSECDGNARKIATGKDHCLIWTDKNKVFGAGCNRNYQLVPQGQCRYDYAVELQVTDYLSHNNATTTSFAGNVTEVNTPIVNSGVVTCGKALYVKQEAQRLYLGNLLQITDVNYFATNANNATAVNGTLTLPLYVDVRYSGFIGVDGNGVASGTISYETSGIYTTVPSNSLDSTGTFTPAVGTAFEVNNTIDDLVYLTNPTSVGTATVAGYCGQPISVPLDTTLRGALTVETVLSALGGATLGSTQQSVLSLTLASGTNVLGLTHVALVNGNYSSGTPVASIIGTPAFPLNLECCTGCCPNVPSNLPKKCWKNIFAGFDLSVLVDDCNGMFVLGSLHKLRDNGYYLKNNCIQDIVNNAYATVTFPASELNCASASACPSGCGSTQKFSQDLLNKVGVQFSFDPNSGSNVCDLLQNMQNCNAVNNCQDSCTNCDTSVYLDIDAAGTNPVDTAPLDSVATIILYNRRSLSKQVSTITSSNLILSPSYTTVNITSNSFLDFNANKYCIDGTDYSVDKPLMLNTPNAGSTVVMYIDTDYPGSLRFSLPTGRTNNVRFVGHTSVSSSTLLNYGSAPDPVVLTNLKTVTSTITTPFTTRQYRNPPVSKLISTYLQGGDCVCFSADLGNERLVQSVTADLPTLFRLNRSVLQVGVGNNFLTVLSGSLTCQPEVLGLGVNCNGQLGLGSRQNTLVWKNVNKCYFPCPVVGLACGETATLMLLQSGAVWGTGVWKCLLNSLIPTPVATVPASWRIRKALLGRRSLLLLGADGQVYGVGDNSVGELGNGSTSCIGRPSLLSCCTVKGLRRLTSELNGSCCGSCAAGGACCLNNPDENVTYTRRSAPMRTGKYIPNNRVSMCQRYNK